MYKVCALALTVMCLVASAAHAATVRLDWTGAVAEETGLANIGRNEVITGSLVYDTDAPQTVIFSNSSRYDTAVISSSFSVAGFSGQFTGGSVEIFDNLADFGPTQDVFVSRSTPSNGFTGDTIDGQRPTEFFLILQSGNLAAINGTQLPTALDSSLFTSTTRGQIDLDGGFKLFFGVTSFQTSVVPAPVPLPAAAWMMLSGLSGFGALRWRNRHRSRHLRANCA